MKSGIPAAWLSPKNWKDYPFLTQKGIDLIKAYTAPRTHLGMGRYGSYKDYGDTDWKIGWGSYKIGKHVVNLREVATYQQIEKQLIEDLKEFSNQVAEYVFVPLNTNRKAAILSFAHSLGIVPFKKCRLLELINSHASRKQIIQEWSPHINPIWRSGGELIINRRRSELDMYFAADKEIPTMTPHVCKTEGCLLNLVETYKYLPSQIRAIEYLERKITEWDPSGASLRYFFRLWSQRPTSLGSEQPQLVYPFEEDQEPQ